MIHSLLRIVVLVACCVASPIVQAATIFQALNSTYVAWEAEDAFSISNNAPTIWVVTNDVAANASGGQALYPSGTFGTVPLSSYASYAIRFRSAGVYTLYLRWRADKAATDLDPNNGNSYYRPNDFGDLGPELSNYATSSLNNSRQPPAVNNYAMGTEGLTYTVTQEQVDAGVPLILKFGNREPGMFIDRVVLSQNPALTEVEFNALPNSDTDIVPQGANETYVAFEAERVSRISNNAPTIWVVTNDVAANASGGQALYPSGTFGTVPLSSYASYAIRFRSAGVYTLYLRWRADKAATDLDPNNGNSYYRPNDFGDLGPELSNYATSSLNNSRQPPAVNNYAMGTEGLTYTVTQEQVDAGVPLILKFGNREPGMFIDRVVLSQNPALTEVEFNALPNSGSIARPSLVKAVGSASLTNVTVTFDRPLDPASVIPGNFTLSGSVNVTGATLNPNTSKDVLLTTATQAQGSNYVVTVNGVTDVSSNAIAANSTISFTSWKIANGWITRELYYNVAGATVNDLIASPNFPNSPDALDFVRTVSIGNDLQLASYGARFRAFFIPPQAGAYEFYLYANDEAQFSLSSNESADNLLPLILSVTGIENFDPGAMWTTGTLNAGQRYLFEVLYKQDAGAAVVGLGARRVGTPGNVADIPLLGGSMVATFVNPDAASVNITQQPVSTTVPAGQRAKFTVSATAPKGGILFYQWQVNGVDIPSATRPTYVTPILAGTDSGKKYRCIVGANGTDVPSEEATITVGPAQPIPLVPYVGINFASGGDNATTAGATMATNDVAGVVLQEYFNNIVGRVIDGTQVLMDAQGAATPVTIAVWDTTNGLPVQPSNLVGIGTGTASADHVMLQGSIANNNLPLSLLISNVPPGTYNLIAYSVGFSFNTTYEEDFSLVGATTYPTLTVRGQTSVQFLADPVLVRMNSTNAASRALGNYVMYENVSPAVDSTLLLTVSPQSTNTPNTGFLPPVNALQLVKVVPVQETPSLTVARQGANLMISWTAAAAGYVLVSSPTIDANTPWTNVVPGTPNPITGAGSVNVSTALDTQFYRLKK